MSSGNLSSLDLNGEKDEIDAFLEALDKEESKAGGALASSKNKIKTKPKKS
jgi:hypothetical protein